MYGNDAGQSLYVLINPSLEHMLAHLHTGWHVEDLVSCFLSIEGHQ